MYSGHLESDVALAFKEQGTDTWHVLHEQGCDRGRLRSEQQLPEEQMTQEGGRGTTQRSRKVPSVFLSGLTWGLEPLRQARQPWQRNSRCIVVAPEVRI